LHAFRTERKYFNQRILISSQRTTSYICGAAAARRFFKPFGYLGRHLVRVVTWSFSTHRVSRCRHPNKIGLQMIRHFAVPRDTRFSRRSVDTEWTWSEGCHNLGSASMFGELHPPTRLTSLTRCTGISRTCEKLTRILKLELSVAPHLLPCLQEVPLRRFDIWMVASPLDAPNLRP
jgi:hypothetical protein